MQLARSLGPRYLKLLCVCGPAVGLCVLARWRRRAAAIRAAVVPRAGVRILAQCGGLTFVHKPGLMSTHPSEKPRPVRASGNLLCPACGRDFGADEGWHWISMRDHVASHPDEQHVAWRRAHPGPLERPVADEEVTLWHVLRDWHRARGELGAGGGGAGGGGAGEGDGAVRFCNRLDRGTSGIVCVAATARLAERVQACWHQASKEYLVLVRGSTEAHFAVCRPLTDRGTKRKEAPQRLHLPYISPLSPLYLTTYSLLIATYHYSLLATGAAARSDHRVHQVAHRRGDN